MGFSGSVQHSHKGLLAGLVVKEKIFSMHVGSFWTDCEHWSSVNGWAAGTSGFLEMHLLLALVYTWRPLDLDALVEKPAFTVGRLKPSSISFLNFQIPISWLSTEYRAANTPRTNQDRGCNPGHLVLWARLVIGGRVFIYWPWSSTSAWTCRYLSRAAFGADGWRLFVGLWNGAYVDSLWVGSGGTTTLLSPAPGKDTSILVLLYIISKHDQIILKNLYKKITN